MVYVVQGPRRAGDRQHRARRLQPGQGAIEKANYEVKPLVLAREGKVPDDAAVVIVAGPARPISSRPSWTRSTRTSRGRQVFFMAPPFQPTPTKKCLRKYGFTLGDDLVIELNPIGQLFGMGPQVPIVQQYEPHPITRDMGGVMTLFPLTRSVTPAKALPKGVQASPLAQTSRAVVGRDRQERLPDRQGHSRPRREDRPPAGRGGGHGGRGAPPRPRVARRPKRRRRPASWWWAPPTSRRTSSWAPRATGTSS